jgi:hypothetical protein
LSNPEDPEYKKNLAMCFLSLSSKKNHLERDDCYKINDYVSKKTAKHLLGIYYLNVFEGGFFSEVNGNEKCNFFNISLLQSLINHRCLSNVISVCFQNKIVTFVTRPIKAGEQLFACYL